MEQYQHQRKILELFPELSDKLKYDTLLKLLDEGIIDLASVMVIYAQRLTTYKQEAQQDMETLSRAGLDLAEKEIKKIPAIKSLNKKQLKTAQVYTLLFAGGYDGTGFVDELKKCIDMSIVDADWYERAWRLKSKSKLNGGKEK